jgi:hypothetical protein
MSWPDVIWGLITGMLLLHACSLAHQHFTGYAPPEFIVIGRDEMSRLTDKLAAAAAVAPRQAAKIEARADKLIAAEADLEQKTSEAFGPHEALLAEAQRGVEDLQHALATMSNMPPLSASDGSSTPLPAGSGLASTEPAT